MPKVFFFTSRNPIIESSDITFLCPHWCDHGQKESYTIMKAKINFCITIFMQMCTFSMVYEVLRTILCITRCLNVSQHWCQYFIFSWRLIRPTNNYNGHLGALSNLCMLALTQSCEILRGSRGLLCVNQMIQELMSGRVLIAFLHLFPPVS